jgi:hypothetical protein
LLAKDEHHWQKGLTAEEAEAPGKNYTGFQVQGQAGVEYRASSVEGASWTQGWNPAAREQNHGGG